MYVFNLHGNEYDNSYYIIDKNKLKIKYNDNIFEVQDTSIVECVDIYSGIKSIIPVNIYTNELYSSTGEIISITYETSLIFYKKYTYTQTPKIEKTKITIKKVTFNYDNMTIEIPSDVYNNIINIIAVIGNFGEKKDYKMNGGGPKLDPSKVSRNLKLRMKLRNPSKFKPIKIKELMKSYISKLQITETQLRAAAAAEEEDTVDKMGSEDTVDKMGSEEEDEEEPVDKMGLDQQMVSEQEIILRQIMTVVYDDENSITTAETSIGSKIVTYFLSLVNSIYKLTPRQLPSPPKSVIPLPSPPPPPSPTPAPLNRFHTLTSTNQQEVGNCWAQSLFYVLKRYLTELEQYTNIADNNFKFYMGHNNLNIFLSSKFLNTASIIGTLNSTGVIRGYIDKNINQLKTDIETEINNYIRRTGDTINQGDINNIVIIFTNVVVYYMFCVFAFDTINVTNQSMLTDLSFSIESKMLNQPLYAKRGGNPQNPVTLEFIKHHLDDKMSITALFAWCIDTAASVLPTSYGAPGGPATRVTRDPNPIASCTCDLTYGPRTPSVIEQFQKLDCNGYIDHLDRVFTERYAIYNMDGDIRPLNNYYYSKAIGMNLRKFHASYDPATTTYNYNTSARGWVTYAQVTGAPPGVLSPTGGIDLDCIKSDTRGIPYHKNNFMAWVQHTINNGLYVYLNIDLNSQKLGWTQATTFMGLTHAFHALTITNIIFTGNINEFHDLTKYAFEIRNSWGNTEKVTLVPYMIFYDFFLEKTNFSSFHVIPKYGACQYINNPNRYSPRFNANPIYFWYDIGGNPFSPLAPGHWLAPIAALGPAPGSGLAPAPGSGLAPAPAPAPGSGSAPDSATMPDDDDDDGFGGGSKYFKKSKKTYKKRYSIKTRKTKNKKLRKSYKKRYSIKRRIKLNSSVRR